MSYRFPTIVPTLVLAVLLAGCHNAKALLPPNLRAPSEDTGNAMKLAREQLLHASPCCSSFADFSYQARLPWQPEKFTLGNGSMVAVSLASRARSPSRRSSLARCSSAQACGLLAPARSSRKSIS